MSVVCDVLWFQRKYENTPQEKVSFGFLPSEIPRKPLLDGFGVYVMLAQSTPRSSRCLFSGTPDLLVSISLGQFTI